MRTRKQSAKLKEDILALYASGLSKTKIAKKSKVSRTYVIKITKQSND